MEINQHNTSNASASTEGKAYKQTDVQLFLDFFKTTEMRKAISTFELAIISVSDYMLDVLEKKINLGELPWHSLYIARDWNQEQGFTELLQWYNVAIKYWEYKGFNDNE